MVFVPIRPGTAVRYGLRQPDPEESVTVHPLVRRGTFTISEMRSEFGLPPAHWGLNGPANGYNVGGEGTGDEPPDECDGGDRDR